VGRSWTSSSIAIVFSIALLVVLGTPGRAWADDAPWYKGVPKDRQTKASELFRKGNGFFEQSEYARSAELYEKALALWDHPGIHFNLAVSLVNLDRLLDANTHLEAALKWGAQGLDKTRYQDAQTYRRLIDAGIVKLTVETIQDGVDVTLDGKPILSGKGRKTIVVLPGAHALVATKRGFEPLTKSLSLMAGTPHTEKVEIRPRVARTVWKRRFRTWVPWLVTGAGLATVAVGAGTITIARAHERDFENQFKAMCPAGCAWDSMAGIDWGLHDRAVLEHRLGLATVGVGGALVLTGLVMVALNQPREFAVPGEFVMRASRSGVGVAWLGEF
jgi:hypothetical protein